MSSLNFFVFYCHHHCKELADDTSYNFFQKFRSQTNVGKTIILLAVKILELLSTPTTYSRHLYSILPKRKYYSSTLSADWFIPHYEKAFRHYKLRFIIFLQNFLVCYFRHHWWTLRVAIDWWDIINRLVYCSLWKSFSLF